jgi:hypothetical protein
MKLEWIKHYQDEIEFQLKNQQKNEQIAQNDVEIEFSLDADQDTYNHQDLKK